MTESNIQSSQWKTKPIELQSQTGHTFSGSIKFKQTVNEDESVFTHMVYYLVCTQTGKVFGGIGNDPDEVQQRFTKEIEDYLQEISENS